MKTAIKVNNVTFMAVFLVKVVKCNFNKKKKNAKVFFRQKGAGAPATTNTFSDSVKKVL